jgi:hypothetical protein
MGDVPLVQVRRRNPRPKVSCLGLSAYWAGHGEPGQQPGHQDAPKRRLHPLLDTANGSPRFQRGPRGTSGATSSG